MALQPLFWFNLWDFFLCFDFCGASYELETQIDQFNHLFASEISILIFKLVHFSFKFDWWPSIFMDFQYFFDGFFHWFVIFFIYFFFTFIVILEFEITVAHRKMVGNTKFWKKCDTEFFESKILKSVNFNLELKHCPTKGAPRNFNAM